MGLEEEEFFRPAFVLSATTGFPGTPQPNFVNPIPMLESPPVYSNSANSLALAGVAKWQTQRT